jgi:hypothetical protein
MAWTESGFSMMMLMTATLVSIDFPPEKTKNAASDEDAASKMGTTNDPLHGPDLDWNCIFCLKQGFGVRSVVSIIADPQYLSRRGPEKHHFAQKTLPLFAKTPRDGPAFR